MKNEALEVLKNRRSIRKFKSEQITDGELLAVLEAGTYAPTGKNMQTPVIIAVQKPEDRQAVAELNAKVMGSDSDPYYGAPTIILVLAADDAFAELNGSAVTTNMLNAAYAVGLGSCWIHRAAPMFKSDEGKAMLRKWGVDESLVGVGSIALGYADCETPAAKPRKENYYRIIK
ncbi:MAG: nitroreductase family protein [Butyricicoccus sp.]|nr:nitroreductase family protein [Butyricicoccus sp.]